jgi:hypothetical protein
MPLSIVFFSTLSYFFFLSPFTLATMASHPFSTLSFSTLLFLLSLSSFAFATMAPHPFFILYFSTFSSLLSFSHLSHLLALVTCLSPFSIVFKLKAQSLLAASNGN